MANPADADERAPVGADIHIWHCAEAREFARIGGHSVIGHGPYVGPSVIIAPICRLSKRALVPERSLLKDGVFVDPGVVFPNGEFPHAINVNGP